MARLLPARSLRLGAVNCHRSGVKELSGPMKGATEAVSHPVPEGCIEGKVEQIPSSGNDTYTQKKGELCTVLHCNVGLPLCCKAFSENATPHQQHWANSVQKSPRQPLVHDWLATPETLMMLNRHRSKYRGNSCRGKYKTVKRLG